MLLAYRNSTHWYSDSHTIRALLRLLEYPLAFVVGSITVWWHKRKQEIALSWPMVEGCVQFHGEHWKQRISYLGACFLLRKL